MSTINESTNEHATNFFQEQSVDCVGTTYVKPTMWQSRLAAIIAALLILLGIFLYLQGLFSIAIVLITACLACLAILAIIARASTTHFLGRQNNPYDDMPLGRYLSSDKNIIKLNTPTLSDEEAANIDLHRATEAVLVSEWVINARTPRRIQVRSDDGTALAGRMIPGTKRLRPWVLLLHGFGGSWRDSLAFSRIYAAHDCNIMLVDMRAHGESEGEWTGSGWLDRRDIIAWCSWIIARTGEEVQIIIHGTGMGATAALFAAQEKDFPAQARAIVSDSAYIDIWNETALRLGNGFAKPQPMLDLSRTMLRKSKGGYDLGKGNILPGIPGISTPLFIMHGEEDACTPPYMGIYLAMAAGCDVDTIVDAVTAKQVMADIAKLKTEANNDDKAERDRDNTTSKSSNDASRESFADSPEDDLLDLIVDQPPTEDETPTGSEASPYIAASPTGNMFFFAPSAGHCQASFACPTSYENALNTFLDRCIG